MRCCQFCFYRCFLVHLDSRFFHVLLTLLCVPFSAGHFTLIRKVLKNYHLGMSRVRKISYSSGRFVIFEHSYIQVQVLQQKTRRLTKGQLVTERDCEGNHSSHHGHCDYP